jgi:hypothetical protein
MVVCPRTIFGEIHFHKYIILWVRVRGPTTGLSPYLESVHQNFSQNLGSKLSTTVEITISPRISHGS